MTEEGLALLAAWYRSERRQGTDASEVFEYANDIGISMDAQDGIDLFHYINNREDDYARHHEPVS